jgi:hypothetical protein
MIFGRAIARKHYYGSNNLLDRIKHGTKLNCIIYYKNANSSKKYYIPLKKIKNKTEKGFQSLAANISVKLVPTTF